MAADTKTIRSMMDETRKFEPPAGFVDKAHIKSRKLYEEMYERSIRNPEDFWGEYAKELHWFKKWDKVLETDFRNAKIQWFLGGKLNVSDNCLDRHLSTSRRDKAALIWEGEPEGEKRAFTYHQLHSEVCRFANVLKKKGIRKGDRVAIYLPMIPELPIAMLACARIGAIHSIVFGGFSADSLRDRILDCDARLLITSDGSFRSGKTIALKKNADQALTECPMVKDVIVVNRTQTNPAMQAGRDTWWDEELAADDITPECEPEAMDAEDPLFILYTSPNNSSIGLSKASGIC